jgi:hypothetical protein
MTNTDMAIAVLVEEMGDRCLMWGIGDQLYE